MTIPPKRQISGTGTSTFTGKAHVQGVGAQIDSLAPAYATDWADVDTGEERRILPGGEHALTGEMGQIDRAFDAVVVAEPDPVGLEGAHFYGAGQ